jgi:hypothetical protein
MFVHNEIPVDELRGKLRYDRRTGKIFWHNEFRKGGRRNPLFGKEAGTTAKGYVQIGWTVRQRKVFLGGHRVAWALHFGAWPEGLIDHLNHDTMDNRIENLRLAAPGENSCHRRELRGATPYKGVYYMSAKGRFAAQIKVSGKHTWLGLYETAMGAAYAYDAAAVRMHGNFALTNHHLGLLPHTDWITAP